jgi:hypothetical protein
MKEQSSNQKKTVSRANTNQPFFQKKSEHEPFFKPKESENSFFGKGSSFFQKPLSFNSTPIQQKRNENLPEDLQTKMEDSFGQDFSNVNIQKNSQESVDLNARAFTKGDSIHFAPSEFNPNSEKGKNLIGHEFAHVTQQRSGVVKPTSVMGKGFNLNDDRGLEREADSFGQKAVKGEPIPKYKSSSLGIRNKVRVDQAKSNVIQRAVTTWGGDWDTSKYDLVTPATSTGLRGVDIELEFEPNNNVDAQLIGLTQSVRSIKNKNPYFINKDKFYKDRSIKSKDAIEVDSTTKETDEGAMIDRVKDYNNPIYPVKSQPSSSLDDTNTSAGWGQHGYHYNDASGPKHQKAILKDEPKLNNAEKDSGQIFETTALATKGNQSGTYYGSVKWGWRTSSKGNFTKIPLQISSQGVPSSTFMKSAEIWNNSKDSTGANTIDLPIQWTGTIQNTPLAALRSGKSTSAHTLADLPKGTNLTVLNDTSNWHHVQLDKNQTGIVLNQRGQASVMTGDLIRGYISKELIQKDSKYLR